MSSYLAPTGEGVGRAKLVASIRQGFGLVHRAAKRELWIGIVFEAVAAAALIIILVSGREVVASLTEGGADLELRDVLPETIALAGGLALAGIAGVLVREFRVLVGQLAAQETQRRVVHVATRVPYQELETAEFHDLLRRANSEGSSSSHQVVTSVLSLTNVALTSTSIIILLAVTVPEVLGALVLVAVPFGLAARAAARMGYRMSLALTPSDRLRAYLHSVLTTIAPAKEIRVLGLGPALTDRWDKLYEERIQELRSLTWRRALVNGLASIASAGMVGAVLIVLVRAAIRGSISLADAAIAIVALQQLASRIRTAAASSGSLQQSAYFIRDLQRFLDRPVEDDPEREPVDLPSGDIVFNDVGFTYPGTTKPVLSGIDLTIRRGEVLGVVGVSGSGKTTLAKLLAKLYEPTTGSITVGDDDLTSIPAPDYWRNIAPVFQDFVRYELTARENIGVSDLARSENLDHIREAAERSGAASFLEALDLGYESFLSRGYRQGVELSVGQWQRLAVARAFFRDAPILLFDEPASALDASAEHEVFQVIRDLAAERSVLLISHRFSTIRLADRIVVLDAGKIIERGTHAELLARDGQYARLYRLQAAGYEDGPVSPD